MPMPKKRISKMRRDLRRSHHHLSTPVTGKCSNCSAVIRPHHVCPTCGYYKGKEIVAAVEAQ